VLLVLSEERKHTYADREDACASQLIGLRLQLSEGALLNKLVYAGERSIVFVFSYQHVCRSMEGVAARAGAELQGYSSQRE
jgi:hypothetical protein